MSLNNIEPYQLKPTYQNLRYNTILYNIKLTTWINIVYSNIFNIDTFTTTQIKENHVKNLEKQIKTTPTSYYNNQPQKILFLL